MNSVDDILRTLVAEQIEPIKSKLEEIAKALESKDEGDCFISPKEAGKILGCGDDIIKQLQDAGQLSLCFKPTVPKDGKGDNQHRHRLVIRSEVLEMYKKSIARPAKKK
jgi:hypothetical protein